MIRIRQEILVVSSQILSRNAWGVIVSVYTLAMRCVQMNVKETLKIMVAVMGTATANVPVHVLIWLVFLEGNDEFVKDKYTTYNKEES